MTFLQYTNITDLKANTSFETKTCHRDAIIKNVNKNIVRFSKITYNSMAQNLPEISRMPNLGVKMKKNVRKK